MATEAMMQPLGSLDGVAWYWAAQGRFDKPGVYFWDGKRNVHVSELSALLRMVLDDMDTCCGELGSDYEFKELSSETVGALNAYRAGHPPRTSRVPFENRGLKEGDEVVNSTWTMSKLYVVDINHAIDAVAVRLGDRPGAGIVVWPLESVRKADGSKRSETVGNPYVHERNGGFDVSGRLRCLTCNKTFRSEHAAKFHECKGP